MKIGQQAKSAGKIKKPSKNNIVNFTTWIGSNESLIIHSIVFGFFFLISILGADFDKILLVLTTLVSLEAIYLSIFIQMSVNRQGEQLEIVSEDIEEIQEDVEEIQKDVEGIEEDIDEIQEDVEEIEKDIDEIQEDVEEIQEDVDELPNTPNTKKSITKDSIDSKQNDLNKNILTLLQSMDQKIQDLQKELAISKSKEAKTDSITKKVAKLIKK